MIDQPKTTKPPMAIFNRKHRLDLPGGYWVEKSDENRWQVGSGRMYLGFGIDGNVPVGTGGSMDAEIGRFVEAMRKGIAP